MDRQEILSYILSKNPPPPSPPPPPREDQQSGPGPSSPLFLLGFRPPPSPPLPRRWSARSSPPSPCHWREIPASACLALPRWYRRVGPRHDRKQLWTRAASLRSAS